MGFRTPASRTSLMAGPTLCSRLAFRRTLVCALSWLISMTIAPPGQLSAQDVSNAIAGTIREAGQDRPISGAEILVVEQDLRALSDSLGAFRVLGVGGGRRTLIISALGYSTDSVSVVVGGEGLDLVLSLTRAPFELDPIEVSSLTFGDRLEAVEGFLEARVERLPGQYRVATREDLWAHENDHDSDPWRMIADELGARWAGPESVFAFARRVRPQVYIDEQRRFWFQFLETRPASLCRVELYVPPRFTYRLDDRPAQIRAYTCGFLARAVAGQERIAPIYQERLIAGG